MAEEVALLGLNIELPNCAICDIPCTKKCTHCNLVFYCSREHQREHWRVHKPDCTFPYKVEQNTTMGRYLVATRKINCFDMIVRENAMVSIPTRTAPLACLACYKEFQANNITPIECPSCGALVCSLQCSQSQVHYPECFIIQTHCKDGRVKIDRIDRPHLTNQAIGLFRCFALKETDPEAWEKINELQSNYVKRNNETSIIANHITNTLNCTEFSEFEIANTDNIIITNGITTTKNSLNLYYTASFLEHNCHANSFTSFARTGELEVRAAEIIEAGEHISICYCNPIWSVFKRREALLDTYFIQCKCQRCLDPSEIGTYFNSPKCFNKACLGFMTPTETWNLKKSGWQCSSCRSKRSSQEVKNMLMGAHTALENLDRSSLESCMQYIKNFSKILHPNHYLLTSVKVSIIYISYDLDRLSDKRLDTICKYLRQLKELLIKLIPAETKSRGLLLHLLFELTAEGHRRKLMRRGHDMSILRTESIINILEYRRILHECYQYLRYEHHNPVNAERIVKVKATTEEIKQYLGAVQAAQRQAQ